MKKISSSVIWYLSSLVIGIVLGFAVNQPEKSLTDNLDCSSNITFYSESDTDIHKFIGTFDIKLSEGEGILQLVGQMFANDRVYDVFRKVEVFSQLIDKNDVMLKTKRLIPFPKHDNLPQDLEKKFFFRIYYEQDAEVNYVFEQFNKKGILVKVSLLPRSICTPRKVR